MTPFTTTSRNAGFSKALSRSSSGFPPVIVLNLFHSGLGIVRQLAGSGVRVLGLSADRRIYGNYTRLCEVRYAPDSQEQPGELVDYLLKKTSDFHGAVIFPTRDADILFLDRFREKLDRVYTLAIASPEALHRIMDKAAMIETALYAGVSVPRTTTIIDAKDLRKAADVVDFPCVVKPVRSTDWRQQSRWQLLGSRKALRVNSMTELEREYNLISKVHGEVLLQEWIPGDTKQLVVWGGYIGQDGNPLSYFTARKLVQSPSEFGTGCVVENKRIPDLIEPSLRLCHALDYSGMAEIEYKRDAREGTLKLIEINPRHWDWHQLGEASNVNLTSVAYRDLARFPVEREEPSIGQGTWIAEDSFITYALAGASRGDFSSFKSLRMSPRRRRVSVFSIKDPIPSIRYTTTTMIPSILKAVGKKIVRATSKKKTADASGGERISGIPSPISSNRTAQRSKGY